MFRNLKTAGAVLLIGWGGIGSVNAQGLEDLFEFELDPEALQAGTEWVQERVPEAWLAQWPKPAEWQVLWRELTSALQSEDLADLAWIQPQAERALQFLQASPSTEPYASWLLQRIDYLDMAQEMMVEYQTPADLPPRPPPATRPPIAPTHRPPSQSTPSSRANMKKGARSQEKWDRKLAGRKKPARADALVPDLKKIFNEEGVPPEWIWLAEVESSFNPSARSPVGALGLFQFMPATAERFGLKIKPKDERLVPTQSARAAARYLRFLHGRFGSWPLALAAYNAGEGRVGRLLKTHHGSRFEDIVEHLPSETQMYVPKVLATVSLREGVDAQALPPPRPLG